MTEINSKINSNQAGQIAKLLDVFSLNKTRKAYTLAEILIVLGVISVVVAIMLPLAIKLKPDTNKIMFLKTYDEILFTTNKMVNSSKLFPSINQEDLIVYENYPFVNEVEIEIMNKKISGRNKYCNLLGLYMNAENVTCDLTPSLDTVSFSSQNGVDFWVNTTSFISDDSVTWQSDVYFDVNGVSKGNNCLYNEVNCKKPDWFKLMVASDGKVMVADPKGQDYLEKRSTWWKTEAIPSSSEITALPEKDLNKKLERIESISPTKSEPTKEEFKCGGDNGFGKTINCLAISPLDSDGNIKIKSYSPVDEDIYFEELVPDLTKTHVHNYIPLEPFLALPKGATENIINIELTRHSHFCDENDFSQRIKLTNRSNYNQYYVFFGETNEYMIKYYFEEYELSRSELNNHHSGLIISWYKNTDGTFTRAGYTYGTIR